jgi:hypothetical protein
MVAEIGGYSGLLLGVSLMDSVTLLQRAVGALRKVSDCLKRRTD